MNKLAYYRRFSKIQQNRERIYTPIIHRALRKQYSDFIEQAKQGNYSTDNINAFELVPIISQLWYDSARTFGAHIHSLLRAEIKQKRNPLGFTQRIVDIINAYYKIDILNICQGIADTTVATKASATANIKSVQIYGAKKASAQANNSRI